MGGWAGAAPVFKARRRRSGIQPAFGAMSRPQCRGRSAG
ncbi:hypothetical protein [Azospirillum doebereinerae]